MALSHSDQVHFVFSDHKIIVWLSSVALGKAQAKAGQEPGELGKVRKKLLYFLETSQHYVPAELISSFPSDGMKQFDDV